MAEEITMLQRVGAAILLAESQWNPKTAKESEEKVTARAALEAMRDIEPTEAMMSALWSMRVSNTRESFQSCWQAMIDAALTPQ